MSLLWIQQHQPMAQGRRQVFILLFQINQISPTLHACDMMLFSQSDLKKP